MEIILHIGWPRHARAYGLVLFLFLSQFAFFSPSFFAQSISAPSIGATVEPGSLFRDCTYTFYVDGSSVLATKGDGSGNKYPGTNHRTVIQDAIDNGGTGKYCFTAGTYDIPSGTGIIFPTKVQLIGAGVEKTIIRKTAGSQTVLVDKAFNDNTPSSFMDYVEISHMTFDDNGANANPVIRVGNIRNSYIHDILIKAGTGTGLISGPFGVNLDTNVLTHNIVERIKITRSGGAADVMITAGYADSIVRDIELSGGGQSGLTMAACLRTKFINLLIHDETGSGSALTLEPAANGRITGCEIINLTAYGNGGAGINTGLQASFFSTNITIINPRLFNNADGIIAQNIRSLKILGGMISDYTGAGIALKNVRDAVVYSPTIFDFGIRGSGTIIGIEIANETAKAVNLANIQIFNPTIYRTLSTSNTLHGIRISSSPIGTNNTITGGAIYMMTGSAIRYEPPVTAPANFQVKYILGYTTENQGATSVADGGTISHGLVATPTSVICTTSIASQFCSVTAKSSTTFTVAIKTDTGGVGTTQTVYWWAVYWP